MFCKLFSQIKLLHDNYMNKYLNLYLDKDPLYMSLYFSDNI